MARIGHLAPLILRWEGGYVNDPRDRGGETNRGVTIATWQRAGHDCREVLPKVVVGRKTYYNVTRSLYEMTDAQWLDILRRYYWNTFRADDISDQSVADICVDWVWASGVAAVKRVQLIVGVSADGIVGPKTIAAINARPAEPLFQQLRAARIAFVETIVKKKPSQRVFLQGWKNRIQSFTYEKN